MHCWYSWLTSLTAVQSMMSQANLVTQWVPILLFVLSLMLSSRIFNISQSRPWVGRTLLFMYMVATVVCFPSSEVMFLLLIVMHSSNGSCTAAFTSSSIPQPGLPCVRPSSVLPSTESLLHDALAETCCFCTQNLSMLCNLCYCL